MNKAAFLALLSGSLSYQHAGGNGSITGSGPVRYRAAENARWSYCQNPGIGTITTGWSGSGGGSVADSDFVGGRAIESSSLAANGSCSIVSQMRLAGLVTGSVVTISFDIKQISGPQSANGVGVRVVPCDAAGSTAGFTASTQSNYTLTNSVQRVVKQITIAANTGVHGISVAIGRSNEAANIVYRFSRVLIEPGATDGSWFDPVWLDPITGILGTAHASPSVSRAVAWTEEATTNLAVNPSAENTHGLAFASGSGTTYNLSNDAAYAILGAKAAKIEVTVLGSAQFTIGGGAVAATGGLPYTISVWLRGSGQGVFRLAGSTSGATSYQVSTGTITLTDAWVKYELSGTIDPANNQVEARWVPSTTGTVWIDCEQTEQRSSATSFCDGSIGTGYTWAGTAHASASSRAAGDLSLPLSGLLSGLMGAMAARGVIIAGAGGRCYFDTGPTGTGKDRIALDSSSNQVSGWFAGNNVNPGGYIRAGAVSIGTWDMVYAEWNGTATAVADGAGARTTGTRNAPSGDLSTTLYIGRNNAGSGASYINGGIGPIMGFSSPLTDSEKSAIAGRTAQWHWDMLATMDGSAAASASVPTADLKRTPRFGALPIAGGAAVSSPPLKRANPLAGAIAGIASLDRAPLILILASKPILSEVFTGRPSSSSGPAGHTHVARLDDLARHGAAITKLSIGESITVTVYDEHGDVVATGLAFYDGGNGDWAFAYELPDGLRRSFGLVREVWSIAVAGDSGLFVGRARVGR